MFVWCSTINYFLCLNTSKATSCLRRSKIVFLIFPTRPFFLLNFGTKNLKSDIAFLRYGNFIEDVITDWWKVDSQKEALKVLESREKISKCLSMNKFIKIVHNFHKIRRQIQWNLLLWRLIPSIMCTISFWNISNTSYS